MSEIQNVENYMNSNKLVTVLNAIQKDIIENPNLDKSNLLLEGTDLQKLKLMQLTHKGKVDVAIVDINSIVLNKKVELNGEYLSVKTKKGKTALLEKLTNRFNLIKPLLTEDSVIYILVDDYLQPIIKQFSDEFYGDKNSIGSFINNKGIAKNDKFNMQASHEFVLVYANQLIDVNSRKAKQLLVEDVVRTYKVHEKVLANGEKVYYRVDSGLLMGGSGEGSTLNNRVNLGYTLYYNDETGHVILEDDVNKDKARYSNDVSEVYNTNEELISEGYVPIRPIKANATKLGCWKWSMEKLSENATNIMITPSNSPSGYIVNRVEYVDISETYEKNGKLYVDRNKTAVPKSLINFTQQKKTNHFGFGVPNKFVRDTKLLTHLLSIYAKKEAIVLDVFDSVGSVPNAVFNVNRNNGKDFKFVSSTDVKIPKSELISYLLKKDTIDAPPTEYSVENMNEWNVGFKTYLDSKRFKDLQNDAEFVELSSKYNYTYNIINAIISVNGFAENVKIYKLVDKDSKPYNQGITQDKFIADVENILAIRSNTFKVIVEDLFFDVYESETIRTINIKNTKQLGAVKKYLTTDKILYVNVFTGNKTEYKQCISYLTTINNQIYFKHIDYKLESLLYSSVLLENRVEEEEKPKREIKVKKLNVDYNGFFERKSGEPLVPTENQ